MAEESKGTGKLAYLSSVEIHKKVETEIDYNKKKYFITFPYPYMNGKLHLGHLFSFTKSDFMAYFKELQGYNVLFPFSFHCTGMPIVALAQKLNEERQGKIVDISTAKILKNLGFVPECSSLCKGFGDLPFCSGCVGFKERGFDNLESKPIYSFIDPYHWCITFPAYCKQTLINVDARIDWRRSFITTDINPYYDSFVRYQFYRLKELNLLKFGKRYSIYCPIDNQICLDHDRRKGEGINPKNVICLKLTENNRVLLVEAFQNKLKNINLSNVKVYINSNVKFIEFMHKGIVYVIEELLFNNLKNQLDKIDNVKEVEDIRKLFNFITVNENVKFPKLSFLEGTSDLVDEFSKLDTVENELSVLIQSEHFIRLSIPESPVISRSGGDCVVCLTDQWYIEYSNKNWKKKVHKCINEMKSLTPALKTLLFEALDWMNKWGFSRSFGLGTRIPWDRQYLIDSLSDSTIYMALYTFKHYLFKDIKGNEEIFPSKLLCDEVWKFIFGQLSFSDLVSKLNERLMRIKLEEMATSKSSINISVEECMEILEKCRLSFSYFYPVDLRVSGKDLIGNHLMFYIYNHVVLFEEKHWPKNIFTNGHIMLNNSKMSKSEGNFLSTEDAVRKYGSSGCRMCLADCGDTNEDANFVESVTNAVILKMWTLTKSIEEISGNINDHLQSGTKSKRDEMASKILLNSIYHNVNQALIAYEEMAYKNVVKYAFHENLNIIEKYIAMVECKDNDLLIYAYTVIVQMIYPITPSLCRYLASIIKCKIELPSYYGNNSNKKLEEGEYFEVDKMYIGISEYLKSVISKVSGKKVKICLSSGFSDMRKECMAKVDELRERDMDKSLIKKAIFKETSVIMKKYNANPNKNKNLIFCMEYFEYPENFKISFNEEEILFLFLDYLKEAAIAEISIGEKSIEVDPYQPVFIFSNK